MKKGQIYEGYVERIDFPNKGIVICDNEIVIVKNVLPKQKISFMVNKKRKGKTEGRLIEVIEKAPYETTENVCPHFGECGGCNYQGIPYDKQLEIKKNQVYRLLLPIMEKQKELDANLEVLDKYIENIFEGIKPSPIQYSYRNKMEFSFGDTYKDGPLALGMHKRGSFYDIVSVQNCNIVDNDFRLILSCVLEYCSENRISYFHKINHIGYLRHLLVRKASKTGEILIAIVTSTQEIHDLQYITKKILDLPLKGKISGILHVKNDSLADVVQSDETVILYGQDYFYEEILGLTFKISPFSFFQTNTLGAEVLYQTVRDFLGDIAKDGIRDKIVFDLYSGTGTITQLLSSVSRKVIGIEIVEEAVKAARQNTLLNKLENCEFIVGDVLNVLDEINEKPDFIVLDPPRDGIHPKALQKIIEYKVDKIVYVSCKPTSLVRDLAIFLEGGYRVERVVAVDQFPATVHVETCVLLTHKKPTSFIEVTMDYEKIVPNQKPGKATYKMITNYVKEKYDLVVKSTTIAEVKRSFGLEVGDYNIKDEKTNYRKEKITPDKRQAVEDALRHFGVIE